MSDYNYLLILRNTSKPNKRFKVVTLGFEAIFFRIERLRATGIAYRVWNDKTDPTRGPALDLVSPPITIACL